jgi:hypothetical protein
VGSCSEKLCANTDPFLQLLASWLEAHQQKTMGHTVGIAVPPQHVASLIDRGEPAKGGAGEINRDELTRDQHIAMTQTAGDIPSDNVAASVEPGRVGEGRARDIP